jgi:hypothetical protein
VNVGPVVGLLLILLGALHVLTADHAEDARTFLIGGALFARSRVARAVVGWIEVAVGVVLIAVAR